MPEFKKTVLPNGVRIVTERHPFSRAVSLGVWVHFGTRDERSEHAGIAHLIEHLVFKGTKTRTAYQLALALESVGGDLNAFTTKEYTCFHALTLKDHVDEALDVVCDLVCNMKVKPRDFALEKGVILQEIAMVEDNHEEQVYDDFFDGVYSHHPIGQPILGTVKSIAEMKYSAVREIYKNQYTGRNLILSVTGDIDHDKIVEQAARLFKVKSARPVARARTPRRRPRWKVKRWVMEKAAEQVHLLWGFPTTSFKDRDRFCAFILNAALGGGMTSRLYQAVRERRGLVYSIHSSLNTFEDAGVITIYAGADAKNVRDVHEIVLREMAKLRRKGLTRSQLEMFKTQLTGGLLLGADEVENRMHSLGVNEMVFGRYRPVDEIVQQIESIDLKTCNRFFRENLDPKKMSWLARGPEVESMRTWWEVAP